MATKDFITYTPSTGSNNATINVTVSKNTGASRENFLTIFGNGVTKKVNINQETGVINVLVAGTNGTLAKVEIPR